MVVELLVSRQRSVGPAMVQVLANQFCGHRKGRSCPQPSLPMHESASGRRSRVDFAATL